MRKFEGWCNESKVATANCWHGEKRNWHHKHKTKKAATDESTKDIGLESVCEVAAWLSTQGAHVPVCPKNYALT